MRRGEQRGRVWLGLAIALASACGSPTSRSPEPAPPEPATPRDVPVPIPAMPEIGWAELPADPPPAARRALREALRAHERGDYAASEAGFRALADAHPDATMARFDLACALARLGRRDAAVVELEALLWLDHPSIAPRLDGDPDLAVIREDASAWARIASARDRSRAEWASALVRGAPITHVTETRAAGAHEPIRRTAQAGVWLHDARRFVPMSPRIAREVHDGDEGTPLAVAVLDAPRARVLTLSGTGAFSEGGDYIYDLELVARSVPDGVELARARAPRPDATSSGWMLPRVHATANGLALDWLDLDRARRVARGFGEGSALDEHAVPRIEASQDGARVVWSSSIEGATLTRRTLRIPAREIALPEAHHPRLDGRERALTVLAAPDGTLWILTAEREQYGMDGWGSGMVALSRAERDATNASLVLAARGAGAMLVAPDGALYAQVGPRVHRITEGSPPEPLPEGLVLVPSPYRDFEAR
ncbi:MULTISPECIES: hypothetical protein [Sandaracinus]|uniref:hypothetical protein n=1 Tax=Sandaracinus TaxID=1055688 RepID=UPI0019D44790|nr:MULTISPECIES: hypothetical protein [Sandaracinus]QRN75731.1 Hypothetical protein MSR10575_88180 [Sandaracinus sp.]UJR87212.1 Hypothetical protein I5071_030 [Sandaracinus amylolyticus]